MGLPVASDPEIAAATFSDHLSAFFADTRRATGGWGRIDVEPLTSVVVIPATRADGTVDSYFLNLDATWYDQWPARVTFVEPLTGWPAAKPGSAHYPMIVGSPLPDRALPGQPTISFALHPSYAMTYGEQRQLACFSHSFDYYFSGHTPTEEQRWRQGTHTICATLSRLHVVLQAPNYVGPSSAPHT